MTNHIPFFAAKRKRPVNSAYLAVKFPSVQHPQLQVVKSDLYSMLNGLLAHIA